MTRTADHVLFGRADLAGDATDSAHRPPMVERGGPRPDRGGRPLPPTSLAGFPLPLSTPPRGPGARPGPPPPFFLFPPPPPPSPPPATRHNPGRLHPPHKKTRRRGAAQNKQTD